MRYLAVAILTAIPTALVTWVFTRGQAPRCFEAQPAAAAAVHGPPAVPASPSSKAVPDENLKSQDVADLLSKPFSVAQAAGVEEYGRQGLFQYINGAAPTYIERGFRRLYAAEMKVNDGGELTCDVYDMDEPTNAASIFDKEGRPSGKPAQIGDEAVRGNMAVIFRTRQFYVKLTAFDAKADQALPKLAAELALRLP